MKTTKERVFRVDPWTGYQWRHNVEKAEDVVRVIDEGRRRYEVFPSFSRELFARLFGGRSAKVDPVRPEDRLWERLHDELDELPGFQQLVRRATGDRLLASVATVAMSDRVLAELPEPPEPLSDPEPLRERVRALQRYGAGEQDVEELLDSLRAQGKAAVEAAQAYAEGLDDSLVRHALRAGIDAAGAALGRLEAELDGVAGWGLGEPGHGLPVEAKAKLAERFRASPKLQELARAAGRMRRLALAKQKSPSALARDEVTDIELGNDLARVLPSELVRLVEPGLALDFARRFVEGRLVQYRLRGKETQGRGPLVILLDSSGSMEGERELWSKAVTMGLLQIAVLQRRRCRVVHFDGAVRRVDDWAPGSIDPHVLVESMEPFFGGGTSFIEPMRSAVEALELEPHLKNADVVLVTDGEAEVGENELAWWRSARTAHKATVYAVHVGERPPPVLAEVADHVLSVKELDDAVPGKLFAEL